MTPRVAPNDGPKHSRLHDIAQFSADWKIAQAVGAGPVRSRPPSMSHAPPGRKPTPDEVAAVLIAERRRVLGEMRHTHGWQNASDADRAEVVDAAIAQLYSRDYNDPGHIAASLRNAVKRRAAKFFARRRDDVGLVDDAADLASTTDDLDAVHGALDASALAPLAEDCLAELTATQAQIVRLKADGVADAAIAKTLDLDGRLAVQKELHAAEHMIAMFAVVAEAGRLCGKRQVSIAAYQAGTASADDVRRAETHLAGCPTCSAAFERTRRALGRQVAALIPLPLLLAADGPRSGLGGLGGRLTDLLSGGGSGSRLESMRDTALGVFVRNPASAETMAGAGLGGAGVAVGAKAAVGLCVAALAGGGAVCSSLGVLPAALNINKPDRAHVAKAKPKTKPKTNAAPIVPAAAALATSTPRSTLPTTTSSAQAPSSRASAAAHAARERRRKAARAQTARKRAAAARAASTNTLQSSTPTTPPGATSTPGAAAAAPPPAPPVQAPASAPKRTGGTASPALTGTSGGFENGTP